LGRPTPAIGQWGATLPADVRLLTRRQIQALADGSIIRVPAALDVRLTPRAPFGDFRVERVDEGNLDPVRQLLLRFNPSDAIALFAYATKMLRFWDGEAAVHEGVSSVLANGLFEIPAPPIPDEEVQFIYTRIGARVLVLLGGYVVAESPKGISIARDAAVYQRQLLRR
jgi:hypothetical protein